MKKYFPSIAILIVISLFITSSCLKKREKTYILQPVCKKQKEYELLRDNILDYPITYKVKEKKCIIEYKKKYIYIDE